MGLGQIRTGLMAAMLRALAFAALAFGVVVPPGYMPARAADHSIVISICTGNGPISSALTLGHKGTHKDQGQHDPRSSCPFAGHQAPQQLPDLAPAPVLVADYVAYLPTPLLSHAQPGTGLSAPPPPSHAPPLPLTI